MNLLRGMHTDRKILHLTSELNFDNNNAQEPVQRNIKSAQDYLNSEGCIVNWSSTETPVSSVDLANLASTLRTLIPPLEQFEKNFHNPCWHMRLSVPPKVNKMLQTTRGNISDAEAFNLINLVFGGSQQQNGASLKSSSSPPSLNLDLPPKSLVCVPMVYFIGFPRSGSTQLYKMLTSHPDLAGGMNKEPHWWTRYLFSSKFPHNLLAVVRYLSHFREASERIAINNSTEQLLIDGSQSTVWDVRTNNNFCALPHLISSIIPNAKFIVLMRNPVDRLFSDFRYLCEEALRIKLKGKGNNRTEIEREQIFNNDPAFNVSADVFHKVVQQEIDDFDSCLASGNSVDVCTHLSTITAPRKSTSAAASTVSTECSRVRLGISLYHVHLKRWLKVIPKERLLFLRTEDMSTDPYSLLERVWQFLGVKKQSKAELTDILHRHLHSSLLGLGQKLRNSTVSDSMNMLKETRELLVKFFQPHNAALSQTLEDERFSWNNAMDHR